MFRFIVSRDCQLSTVRCFNSYFSNNHYEIYCFSACHNRNYIIFKSKYGNMRSCCFNLSNSLSRNREFYKSHRRVPLE
jgi:hypothetical protein